jgi:hypothetical protein
VNAFPTITLPNVTDDERAELAAIHESHEAGQLVKFDGLMALMFKTRQGATLYAGTVPAATKVTRRRRSKAARIARRAAR